jgi:hypothetical protein
MIELGKSWYDYIGRMALKMKAFKTSEFFGLPMDLGLG